MNPLGNALLGTVLDGRYLIEAPIARGGMSTVYRATDTRLGRQVAVKVMHSEFAADPSFLSRFEFEARAVAGLKDPGLVSVYDQGIDGDHAFLVMELVRGGTLRELLRERGPMPPHAAYAVIRPVLAALAAAHRSGLVHRDIKPENVLIADDGDVKLADFGLVRAVAGNTATSSSVMLGTAAYLSPEQVDTGHADPRSDVYSVGILLFEVLTGRTPFPGDTNLSIAYRRLTDDVPPPSAMIAGVPAEFDELVAHATQRDPDERFTDAGRMAAALDTAATRLQLPRFRVPAPRNSAQHRSMAMPPPPPRPPQGAPDAEPSAPDHDRTTVLDPDAGDDPGSGDAGAPGAPGPRPTRVYTAVHPRENDDAGHDAAGPAVPAAEPTSGAPYSAKAARQRRRSRRGVLAWGIVVVVLAALLGVGGWWFTSGRLTTVPPFDGMDRSGIVAAIEDAHLTPRVDETYSDDAPEGAIMSIDPPSGTRIARSSTVTVSVSLGRPTIPDLGAGTSAESAADTLRGRTLVPKRGTDEYSTTVAEGDVVRLSPTSGTTVKVGSTVTITASKGPPPVHIPTVAGRSPGEAEKALQQAHLTVAGRRAAFDPDLDGGKVAGTDPAADAVVPAGSPVTLIVSNAITIPDVAGKTPSKARAALADAGLRAVDGPKTSDTDEDAGTVAKTAPAAGKRIDPDDPAVTVYISDAVTVPSLIGGRVSTARAAAQDKGLSLSVRQLFDSDSSLVISQSPSSGSHVAPGSTVTVTAVP